MAGKRNGYSNHQPQVRGGGGAAERRSYVVVGEGWPFTVSAGLTSTPSLKHDIRQQRDPPGVTLDHSWAENYGAENSEAQTQKSSCYGARETELWLLISGLQCGPLKRRLGQGLHLTGSLVA